MLDRTTPITAETTLPTCHCVINLFHPLDPLAYRLDRLLTNETVGEPYQVPHHQGRKRIHLGLPHGPCVACS